MLGTSCLIECLTATPGVELKSYIYIEGTSRFERNLEISYVSSLAAFRTRKFLKAVMSDAMLFVEPSLGHARWNSFYFKLFNCRKVLCYGQTAFDLILLETPLPF